MKDRHARGARLPGLLVAKCEALCYGLKLKMTGYS